MKGKLKNGFKYEVRDSIVDDMEFVELTRKMQKDPLCVVDLLDYLLGEDQKNALYESLRGEDGIVHATEGDYTVSDAVTEISDAIQKSGTAGKN